MLQYVNSFACAKNEEENHLVIHFRQKEPIIPEEADDIESEIELSTNPVASIIMDENSARKLVQGLLQLYPDIDMVE